MSENQEEIENLSGLPNCSRYLSNFLNQDWQARFRDMGWPIYLNIQYSIITLISDLDSGGI